MFNRFDSLTVMIRLGYFILFLFLCPFVVNGQVYVSEIMYDVEGTDSSREWMEIFNSGSESVDLSGWKLFENDTNHKINLFDEEGDFVVPSYGYAVIVDNPTKFLEDWPDFSGIIFNSAFSLKNSGEEVILRGAELNDIDSVFYDVELGANGDGNSLQKINNLWEAELPTPGEQNSSEEVVLDEEENESVSELVSIDSEYIQPEDLPKIKAYAGKDKTAIAGAIAEFNGEAYGLKDAPLENARYIWNFGDGFLKEGKDVLHFYKYPGEYRVVLDVSSGGYSISDVLIVKVIPNEIFISEVKTGVDSFIEFRNPSKEEINISGWKFISGNQKFTFSKNSFIRPYSYLVIPSYSSGIIFDLNKGQVELLYSGGLVADSFNYNGNLLDEQSFSRIENNITITQETPGSKNKKVSTQVSTQVSTSVRTYVEEKIQSEMTELTDQEQQNPNVQQANIIAVGNDSNTSKKYYYLGVLALIVFAGAGVYVVRHKSVG